MNARHKAIKNCDKWFSLYIRERDGQRCYCGGNLDQPMQCCHLFSRVNLSTRWDERYSFCGHSGCNFEHEHNPHKMIRWFIARFGLDAYDLGYQFHKSVYKISTKEIELMAEDFKRKYEELKCK